MSSVLAAPAKLGNLPLTVEPNAQLLVLNEAGIQKAFPSGHRPDAVFLSNDRKVSVAFEWRDTPLSPGDVQPLVTQFPAVIRAQVPGIKSLKEQLLTYNGNSWAQFVFVASGKNGDVRREMLITSAQNRMLVVTVSSTVADYTKNATPINALTGSLRLN
ncbi:hypothetical protein [Deinococcus sonorensis]|uniref:DUF1795 domain-containing protein n=2 Tax=Deinococcus sonorensis TaxID=309891 RepID=A0AAU7U897_9DEIO